MLSFIKQHEATFDVKGMGRFIIEETNGKLTGMRTVWETAFGNKGTEPIPIPSKAITIPKVIEQLSEYLAGTRKEFKLDIEISGSDIQVKVWKALMAVEYGKTISYSELAKAVEMPTAPRYIGWALSRNPIWIIVPCHRVIMSNGKTGGYAGGQMMKEALLKIERGIDPELEDEEVDGFGPI